MTVVAVAVAVVNKVVAFAVVNTIAAAVVVLVSAILVSTAELRSCDYVIIYSLM